MVVSVYAPASIGNVSVGFDLLGAAIQPITGELLGDVVHVKVCHPLPSHQVDNTQTHQVSLLINGPFADKLPVEAEQNIVVMCARYFLEQVTKQPYQLELALDKNLPVGSGLGSSASSVVATLKALNLAFDDVLCNSDLLKLMGEFEGKISGEIHYDNVAPSFLGGLQLMLTDLEEVSSSIPAIPNWYWIVAYSGHSLSTKTMRSLLPKQCALQTSLEAMQRLAQFVHASHSGNAEMAAKALVDVIAEPARAEAIPGFVNAKQALQNIGVLASGISGSGPTLFAVTDNLALAEEAQTYLEQNYVESQLSGFSHICKIDNQGCRSIDTADQKE
ncbi:homoserine kinase [Psychrosphaera ytuae]|uniref:Homoserine kinase n=1 Tax=Psychrosphaera ytuae TaxID=2820710 RepID=A0A975HIW4_9GAMM|nr:homoserine kinase [Psychrosphaera ytuae]QTH64677.1 homoserine kinase [Psychrosphaera ytuae]